MKAISVLLSRFKPQTFTPNHSPFYTTFHAHQIATDPQHPLCILQRRELSARKKEGLWWHVTSSGDLSKSSVVRSWCRRRLRQAFIEGLKERGFDEFGRLSHADALVRRDNVFEQIVARDPGLSLTGSVRMHVKPGLIAAKFAHVKKETNGLIDILLEGIKDDNSMHQSATQRKTVPTAHRSSVQSNAQSRSKPRPQPSPQSNVTKRSAPQSQEGTPRASKPTRRKEYFGW